MTSVTEEPTEQTQAPEPEKKKQEPRPYIVLQRQRGESPSAPVTWVTVNTLNATSAEQAVRKAAEVLIAADAEGPITLVAVTANRFKPTTVTASTKTQLKLS